MTEPVSIEIIKVKKELLKDVTTLAAIDRGCSLTKVLYVPKEETSEDVISLMCATFHNDHFEDGIAWLTKEGLLPSSGELHVTGVGCDVYREMIAEKTGLSVVFVEELHSQNYGSRFLLKNLDDSEFCFPKIDVTNPFKKPSFGAFQKHHEERVATFQELKPEGQLPAIFVFMGSAAGMTKIDANEICTILGGSFMSGKTFMALGKLLLGTTKYNEIMELASKGDRTKVDTQMKDIFTPNEQSTYGMHDPEQPLYHLGKIAESEHADTEWKKEDIAVSLVNMFMSEILGLVINAAKLQKIGKIYFGGNFIRHEVPRKVVYDWLSYAPVGPMDFQFVKTGHTGAIGAMLTKPGGENEVTL